MTLVITRQVASGFSIWLGRGARSGKNFSSFCLSPTKPLTDVEAALPFPTTLFVRPRLSVIDSSDVEPEGDPE